jgi:hypothetical protein
VRDFVKLRVNNVTNNTRNWIEIEKNNLNSLMKWHGNFRVMLPSSAHLQSFYGKSVCVYFERDLGNVVIAGDVKKGKGQKFCER